MVLVDPLSAIVTTLQKEQIIPDIIPASHLFTPSVLFSIVYPNGSEVNLGNEMAVEEMQDEPEIRLAALNGPWDDAPEASYTLAFLDPDAPYRTDAIYRSFRHWVVRESLSASVDSSSGTHDAVDHWAQGTRRQLQFGGSSERAQDAPVYDSLPSARSASGFWYPQIQSVYCAIMMPYCHIAVVRTVLLTTCLAAFLLFQEPVGGEQPFAIPQGAPEYGAALEERRSWNPITFAEKHGLKLVGVNYFLVRSAEVDTAQ